MAQTGYLSQVLLRHQIYLQRYVNATSKKVVKNLKKIKKDVRLRILEEENVENLVRMKKLQQDINAIISNLSTEKVMEESLKEVVDYEVDFYERVLQSTISVDLNKVSTDVVIASMGKNKTTLIAGKNTQKLNISGLIKKFDKSVKKQARNIITEGLINGESIDQISRKVTRISSNKNAAHAKSMVSTAINHSTSSARAAIHKENKKVLFGEIYLATLDSDTTLICIGFDKNYFRINQGPIPPMHYRCRSIRVPRVKKKYAVPGFEGERPSTGSSGRKPVPGTTTYNSFLKQQSEEFQNDVLGKTRAELFRAGKVKADQFTDKTGKVYSIKDLIRKEKIMVE